MTASADFLGHTDSVALKAPPDGPGDISPADDASVGYVGSTRRKLVLGVLMLINIVNVMDRSLISVLAEPIKREFLLSDTQLGILTGLAFAVVYGFLAIPISRVADRGLYRWVIVACVVVWSSLTFLGGFAQSFLQLAATRVGVAAGEGGLNPASHALISRIFSPQRRGMAMAVFSLGVPLGIATGAIFASHIASAYGWRGALFAVGPIGFLTLPLLFAVPSFPVTRSAKESVAWRKAFALLRHRTYLKVWLGCALSSTFSFGAGAFTGPFFMRAHHMSLTEIGAIFGMTAIVGTGAGAFIGGAVFDGVKRRRPGYELYPSTIALVLSTVLSLGGWILSANISAIAALTAALFFYGFAAIPAMTVVQNLAPVDNRAGASALLGISTGVVGATAGPLIVGVLSDMFAPWVGSRALTYGLCSLTLPLLASGVAYFMASDDLRRKELSTKVA